jgi:hypothetical protein
MGAGLVRNGRWAHRLELEAMTTDFTRGVEAALAAVCTTCNDTHMMQFGERHPVTCTRCPVPCQKCRAGGNGPFCSRTPCACSCHANDWRYRKAPPPAPDLAGGSEVAIVHGPRMRCKGADATAFSKDVDKVTCVDCLRRDYAMYDRAWLSVCEKLASLRAERESVLRAVGSPNHSAKAAADAARKMREENARLRSEVNDYRQRCESLTLRAEATPPVDLSALRRSAPPQGYDELLRALSALDRREMWAAGACDELRDVVSRLRIFLSSCDLADWPRNTAQSEAVGAVPWPGSPTAGDAAYAESFADVEGPGALPQNTDQ